MSQITSRIFIAGIHEAKNYEWLKRNGITHILNTTKSIPHYFPEHFSYFRLNFWDFPLQNLFPEIEYGYCFMSSALNQNSTNKILVHCHAGVSRSVSTVIYFLMREFDLSFQEALIYVQSKRSIANPNGGFKRQLTRLGYGGD